MRQRVIEIHIENSFAAKKIYIWISHFSETAMFRVHKIPPKVREEKGEGDSSEEIAKAKLEKLATLWVAREKQFHSFTVDSYGRASRLQLFKMGSGRTQNALSCGH